MLFLPFFDGFLTGLGGAHRAFVRRNKGLRAGLEPLNAFKKKRQTFAALSCDVCERREFEV